MPATSLDAALRSLFAQRCAPDAPLPPFEVLAVNDGSTDHSPALLERFACREPRLRVLHRPHAGIAAALNAGLACARGSLVARMDADDTAHPERLALQAAHLAADAGPDLSASRVAFGGNADLAYGFAHFVYWQNSLLSAEDIARNRFRDTPVCHPSVMFRRELPEKLGAYAGGDFPEDWEIWLRWLDAGARLEKLPQRLLTWNDPPGRATRADARYRREACDRLRALWLAANLRETIHFTPRSGCSAPGARPGDGWPRCGGWACARRRISILTRARSATAWTACPSWDVMLYPGPAAAASSTPSRPTARPRKRPAG